MKKFSWYTIVHPDYEGWPAPPLYRIVGPLVEEEIAAGEYTCDIYFKPNRKGGYNRKESHLLNVEGKKYFGNRWARYKKLYDPKRPLFQGVPKRNWLKVEITKIHLSMMTFAGILSLSSNILGIKAEEKEDGRK